MMSVYASNLTTQEVLDDQTYKSSMEHPRPRMDRTDSYETKENTRRNSLQPADALPTSLLQSPVSLAGAPSPAFPMPECCQRCSGDGEVAKPCGFCKATGKTRRAQSCGDCEAEKNGCGNTNCDTCHGAGRVIEQCACTSCHGSGSGLKLTCGDCGGSGNVTPGHSRSNSSDVRRMPIPEY